jgi:uncharacterized protein (TIGR03435 family)
MRKAVLGVLAWCCLAAAQTFEVASIKPAAMPTPDGRGRVAIGGPSGGPGSKDPGRVRYPFTTIRNLMTIAYDVKDFQISGPGTIDSERFEVTATMPPETTKQQFAVMMQHLLEERFGLKVHRETRELPMYSLTVAKGGPKMTESKVDAAANADPNGAPLPLPPGGPKIGPDGFPILPVGGRAGLFMIMMPGRSRLTAQQQTMQDLANRLSQQLARPVTDATGLTAKYDFVLTFSNEGITGLMGGMAPPPPPPPGGGAGGPDNVFVPQGDPPPDVFHAVQSQLGLKLDAKKGPVETIVVDKVEKTPTEN